MFLQGKWLLCLQGAVEVARPSVSALSKGWIQADRLSRGISPLVLGSYSMLNVQSFAQEAADSCA